MTAEQMTVGLWRTDARDRLMSSGDEDAVWDADWMLCEALKCGRDSLRWRNREMLAPDTLKTLGDWLAQRISGRPLQYILGSACFMGLDFKCDPRALIPRQDTETLVELALEKMQGRERPRVLDLCTGTGAIGLSVKHFRPDAEVTLTDISRDALSLARENADSLGIDVRVLEGDLWDAVTGEQFDFVLSNPPYLTGEDMNELMREVRFEPALALDGGRDGLLFYRRIAEGLGRALTEGGEALLEIGKGQEADVIALLEKEGFAAAAHKDLCGIDRVIHARKRA